MTAWLLATLWTSGINRGFFELWEQVLPQALATGRRLAEQRFLERQREKTGSVAEFWEALSKEVGECGRPTDSTDPSRPSVAGE